MNYYMFEDMLADVSYLKERYTGLIECETIGYSVQGRPIVMLRVGCGCINMFISAGVHGRESINTGLLVRVISSYIDTYHNKPEFMKYCFCIIPLVNPDGYIKALTDPGYSDYKYNANGVDINRDFPSALWKQTETTGSIPASQPETRAVIAAFKSHPSIMYVDIHSRGNCVYYYRGVMSGKYNSRQQRMADILCRYTGYLAVDPELEVEAGDTGGNTVHYYSEAFGMPAFTIETADDSTGFPMKHNLIERVYINMRYLPEAMIRCCRYI